jgi:hypothetical protein
MGIRAMSMTLPEIVFSWAKHLEGIKKKPRKKTGKKCHINFLTEQYILILIPTINKWLKEKINGYLETGSKNKTSEVMKKLYTIVTFF